MATVEVYIAAPTARPHMGTCSMCFGNNAAAISTCRERRRQRHEVPLGCLLDPSPDISSFANAFRNLRGRRAPQISSTSSRFYLDQSYVCLSPILLIQLPFGSDWLVEERKGERNTLLLRQVVLNSKQAAKTCRKSCVFLMFQQRTMRKKRNHMRGPCHASG